MIPAVIYARYSSSNQREESIAGQIRECKSYAERNGYEIIHEYTDSALTGRSDQRPAFQKMIKDSNSHAFQAVIVWKLDRFARNRYDSAMYRNVLKKNGVKIYSAMENISDSPEGIILEGLMESLAEYYSANLGENVKRGLYDSALERKILGQPTFGYKRGENGRYEIDDMTAPIVKRIFEEYVSGKPYMDIVHDLNTDGFRTIQGKPFSKNSLRKILRNEKYIGVYRYRDILDPDGIPPIIDKSTFERCQKELEKRSFSKTRATPEESEPYLLSGILYCGHCGFPMAGEKARSSTGAYHYYYVCTGKKRHLAECSKKRVQRDFIENAVIKMMNDEILTDEFIDRSVQALEEYQSAEHENETLKILESELNAVNKKINNLLKALEAGIWTDSTADRLREHEERKSALETEIQREKLVQPQFTTGDCRAYLTALKMAFKTDSDAQRLLIQTAIKRIYLFDTDDGFKIVLDLNYGRDDKPVTLEQIVRIQHAHPCHFGNRRTFISGSLLIAQTIKK